ncbi:MAG TPA: pilus assembly protein PilM [Verrucomicrobiae bacterium]
MIDLGSRTSKAIHVQRKGESFALLGFAIQDAPISEKAPSPDLLAEHFKSLNQALGAKTRSAVLTVGVSDSILRHAELPMVAPGDMRMVLKFNSKNYLQQDLPDHGFDCHPLPVRLAANAAATAAAGGKASDAGKSQKIRALVGGARNQLINDLSSAARIAGLTAEQITPGLVGPANAFELAHPDAFQKEVVALVELGFKNSTISILREGELALTRVVAIGGDKLTQGLADTMSISYAEAENIKVGMPDEVKSNLQLLVSPLGRELRASIDFFEHQHDKTVGQVYVSGGAARANCILELLQEELMVPCKAWNPVGFMTPSLPPQQLAELESAAPQLTVAVGAAVGAF